MVNVTNVEVEPKCPLCQSGFVEAMESTRTFDEFTSDHALSLWAPILLNVMGNSRNRRRFRRGFLIDEEDDDDHQNASHDRQSREEDGDAEVDREIDAIVQRRRTSSTILQLLQGIRAGLMAAESHNDRIRDREHLLLINPFNQTIGVQGGSQDSNQDLSSSQNLNPLGSLSDYLIGPGLDLLLQHLSENDPNRYGTPPTQKDVIESLPVVKLENSLQCSVCLDDCEVGSEVTEMPCKHKFHSGCLRPWLELHSTCPVCRFQLPSDETTLDSQVVSNNSSSNNNIIGQENGVNNSGIGRESREEPDTPSERTFTIPWSLSTLFASAASQANTNDANSSLPQSSLSSSSSGAATAPPPPSTYSNGS